MLSYPAEWTPHKACFLAWPSAGDLWGEDLKSSQKEFTELCQAIAGEELYILVSDRQAESDAQNALSKLSPKFFQIPYGDIWLRDTAPIFLISADKKIAAACFKFNGWGGKFILPHDDLVATRIAESFSGKIESFRYSWILEGGSLEVDEFGTCLTTEQCLLNSNRNPGLSRGEIEGNLKSHLGFKKILWLKEGLINDHTDGHIDTIARFAPGNKVICMRAENPTDPNAKILEAIANDLQKMTNAAGHKLEVVEIPSPGEVYDEAGKLMAASYVNFYISNKSVVVPIYGSASDKMAVQKISECFPDRKTVGVFAKNILKGGGAFHCITQQLPRNDL